MKFPIATLFILSLHNMQPRYIKKKEKKKMQPRYIKKKRKREQHQIRESVKVIDKNIIIIYIHLYIYIYMDGLR
jgi:hypothetical protein